MNTVPLKPQPTEAESCQCGNRKVLYFVPRWLLHNSCNGKGFLVMSTALTRSDLGRREGKLSFQKTILDMLRSTTCPLSMAETVKGCDKFLTSKVCLANFKGFGVISQNLTNR